MYQSGQKENGWLSVESLAAKVTQFIRVGCLRMSEHVRGKHSLGCTVTISKALHNRHPRGVSLTSVCTVLCHFRSLGLGIARRPLVCWYHDKSIFYANDCRQSRWVHKSTSAMPYTKGEGHSIMVVDFISADYGWLASPDGHDSAR